MKLTNKKMKNLRLIITFGIIACFIWFLVVYPMIIFHRNESKLEVAAKKYFDLNSDKLPVGDGISTVSMEMLYHQSYLQDNLYSPYTNKACSLADSWVKVKKENNKYQFYTYLRCGLFSSSIDHKGPEIQLNGEEEIIISVGEKYKEFGVKSVIDNGDGTIDVGKVTIKEDVDTSRIGTYIVQYIAADSFMNESIVERVVKVVEKLNIIVKQDLSGSSNYRGDPINNYIRLSNMDFRIYGVDSDSNIIVVADEDVANVNYSKLDEWLDYYYKQLNDKTKDLIVEKVYCNMKLMDSNLNATTCSDYTQKRKVYIPSVMDVNNAESGTQNFMKPRTMSWVANSSSDKEAYVTREIFYGEEYEKSFLSYSMTDNYGVRPMMTIKGGTFVVGGDGTKTDPYVVGDTTKAKTGSFVNDREMGEYVSISVKLWRIIEPLNDGTTKVISVSVLAKDFTEITYLTEKSPYIYNPNDPENVGYYINNQLDEYVDTSYFVTHTINVPIYDQKIIYGEEKKNQKYEVVLSAPNMYEMFSAQSKSEYYNSYWLINSSKSKNRIGAISNIGVPINDTLGGLGEYGIRLVAYLRKNSTITGGDGTYQKPYVIQ